MREKKKAGNVLFLENGYLYAVSWMYAVQQSDVEKTRSQVQTAVPQITVKVVWNFQAESQKKSVRKQRLKVVSQKQQ